ncbi:hypothetical protein [Psychroserpens damuponensis]|uniref:hypothetical protein n=1 Tax=Psychroserpens damuponensis TaxID=943936 RepID=UPI001F4C68E0|nr:hypothetical protein [Psychroserpens damuponensis]
METLISMVLVIVIFMVSSMILNNMFSNTIKNNTRLISSHLNELEYQFINDKLILPYHDEYNGWSVSVTKEKQENKDYVQFSALHPVTNKTVESNTYSK